METYTKESLIQRLKEIRDTGFILNARHGNHGGIGNTLEDLLGIQENNLPLPNAAEWELKTQRLGTSSLTTLFHIEPSPRALRFVPAIFLLKYGWRHQNAGVGYPETEMSFRQTIHGLSPSDRGFRVVIDKTERKVLISFDSGSVAVRHLEWLETTKGRIGHLNELEPQPYWGFDDLAAKARTKLLNTFYIQAKVKREAGQEFYHYQKILKLSQFNFDKFLQGLVEGFVLIDFDARTGHNHGTKFRLRQNHLPDLYDEVEEI
jgi:hypothetical protein